MNLRNMRRNLADAPKYMLDYGQRLFSQNSKIACKLDDAPTTVSNGAVLAESL